jgi:hypothetical protein
MPRNETDVTAMLHDMECRVAWLYSTALEMTAKMPSRTMSVDHDRVLPRMLETSEAFKRVIPQLEDSDLDPDHVLDVAVMLGRALQLLARARMRWRLEGDARLTAAATELGLAGEALHSVLALAPWRPDRDQAALRLNAPRPRKIQ